MSAPAHPLSEQLALPALLHALSDPVRLQIVRRLGEGTEISCGQLGVAVSKSTLSHHLKVLREAGIVGSERPGLWAYYYVIPDVLDPLSDWLN